MVPRIKNKRIWLWLVLSLSCVMGQSQSALLDAFLAQEPSLDSTYLKEQLAVSKHLFRADRPLSDSLLLDAEVKLKTSHYPNLLALAYFMRGNRLGPSKDNKPLAYRYFDLADSVATRSGNYRLQLRTALRYAQATLAAKAPNKTLQILAKAEGLATRYDRTGVLPAIYITQGKARLLLEDYFGSIDRYLLAYKIPGKHQTQILQQLPNFYRRLDQWQKVKDYGEMGRKKAKEDGNKLLYTMSTLHTAYAEAELGQPARAEALALEGWQAAKANGANSRNGFLLGVVARSRYDQGKYSEVIALQDSMDRYGQEWNPTIYTYIGDAYLALGQPRQAIIYGQQALRNARENFSDAFDFNRYNREAYDMLHRAYYDIKDYRSAYAMQDSFQRQRILMTEKANIIKIASALNQSELQKQDDLHELELSTKQAIAEERERRYLFSGLLLLALLSLAAYAAWQLRKRNGIISKQNATITKALDEKDMLLREIHHRVKNNLQLVSSLLTLQGRTIDDETAKEAILEGKARVRSMALIHQDLYNRENITELSPSIYLQKLSKELFSTYNISPDLVDMHLDIQEIDLDIEVMVPLGLIINELMTNSLKYGFPDGKKGEVQISMHEKAGGLELVIADTGVGYDQANVRQGSFGSTLIQSLCQQLEGDMTIESSPQGTKTTIVFKAYKITK